MLRARRYYRKKEEISLLKRIAWKEY